MVTLTWASPVPQNPPASKISAATCVGTNQLEPIPGLLTNLLFSISSSSMESFSCGGRPATDVAIVFSYAFEYIRNIMFGLIKPQNSRSCQESSAEDEETTLDEAEWRGCVLFGLDSAESQAIEADDYGGGRAWSLNYSPAPIITIGIVGVDDPCSGSTVIANAFASTPAGKGGLITVALP